MHIWISYSKYVKLEQFSTALVGGQAKQIGKYFHLNRKLNTTQCKKFHKVTVEWQNATVADLPHKAPFTFRVR